MPLVPRVDSPSKDAKPQPRPSYSAPTASSTRVTRTKSESQIESVTSLARTHSTAAAKSRAVPPIQAKQIARSDAVERPKTPRERSGSETGECDRPKTPQRSDSLRKSSVGAALISTVPAPAAPVRAVSKGGAQARSLGVVQPGLQVGPTHAPSSIASGDGLSSAAVACAASFIISARDLRTNPRKTGAATRFCLRLDGCCAGRRISQVCLAR